MPKAPLTVERSFSHCRDSSNWTLREYNFIHPPNCVRVTNSSARQLRQTNLRPRSHSGILGLSTKCTISKRLFSTIILDRKYFPVASSACLPAPPYAMRKGRNNAIKFLIPRVTLAVYPKAFVPQCNYHSSFDCGYSPEAVTATTDR